MSAELKVVTLRETNLRNVPATLRNIADDIEREEFGKVSCCAVVTLGDTLEVFGMGDALQIDGMGPSVALLLRAASLRFEREIERTGRDDETK